MKKEKLLKLIEESIVLEEKAVPIYAKHLKSVMFWSHISEDKQKIIVEKLKILSKDTKFHITALNKVKKIIEKKA